jgi:hypothetical protein
VKAYRKNIRQPRVTLGLQAADFARLKKLQQAYERYTRIGVSRSIILALALEALEQQMESGTFLPLQAQLHGFKDETR